MDYLRLVEAVDGLGQGIIVGISDAADGRFNACFGKALGVADGDVLRSPVAMMNQACLLNRPAVVEGLLQGVQDKVRMGAARRPPSDDPTGEGNNTAERSMRPIALGRKNYLFMGSESGGKSAAIAYTLIETAKLNGVDPQAWLTDVLGRISEHKITKVDELMPWRYAEASA
jgi:hypothetical protein